MESVEVLLRVVLVLREDTRELWENARKVRMRATNSHLARRSWNSTAASIMSRRQS